jgi:4-hydroxy-4-methyl-2-oxoglutarate aldolase
MNGASSPLTLPPDFAVRARALGSATLYEASGLPCAVDPLVRTVWNGAFIAAPAYPLVRSPGDNLAIHIAMERVPRGGVLVVGTGNFVAGYWAEVLTVAAEAPGVVGLVIDGGVRDVAAMTKRGFPVFARGISVRGKVKVSAPSVGEPMTFTGVPVAQGDLVVADDDGVIVIPAAEAERTLVAGEARDVKEAAMMQQLAQGKSTLELMGLKQRRKNA